jgi:transposase
VDATAARAILAEIGTDMSRFGTAARLASWAGVCPGNDESAGKRRRGKTRKGNRYLRRVLVQCAWAARENK